MAYQYQATGEILKMGQPFLDENGRQHTAQWYHWSAELKQQVGIVEVPDPVIPERPAYNVYCERLVDYDGVWAVEELDIIDAKDNLKGYVSKQSSILRNDGIKLNGMVISTDSEARGYLNGARNSRKQTRKVVTSSGRAELTSSEFNALVDAVEDFIQSCFEREYDLHEEIDDAVTITELKAIAVDDGWPDNGIT